jgi:hypothetical protein
LGPHYPPPPDNFLEGIIYPLKQLAEGIGSPLDIFKRVAHYHPMEETSCNTVGTYEKLRSYRQLEPRTH